MFSRLRAQSGIPESRRFVLMLTGSPSGDSLTGMFVLKGRSYAAAITIDSGTLDRNLPPGRKCGSAIHPPGAWGFTDVTSNLRVSVGWDWARICDALTGCAVFARTIPTAANAAAAS